MTRYHVLVSCPPVKEVIHRYKTKFTKHDIDYTIANVDQQLTENEILDQVHKYDGVLIGDDPFTATVLNKSDRLRVISKWGIGTDNIDTEAASDNEVKVYNTPGTLSNEVSTVVIGYAVMMTRQLHIIDRKIRNGDWYKFQGTSISGKTMGILGVGNIGRAVAKKASGMGMEVVGTDISPLPANLRRETGIERLELDDLLDQSDVLSINCPLTDETENLIGRRELELLGSEGYVINTARGEIIDQDKLYFAVENGEIAGAALDVFEREPLDKADPLISCEKIILGSHNAQNTKEAAQRVTDIAINNLIDGLVNDDIHSS